MADLNLREQYRTRIRPALQQELGLKNAMQVPRLEKIVVSLGVKADNRDGLKDVAADLTKITGQVPLLTKARKSISNFKLREGMTIGAKVTLRGERMYDFLARLISAALPLIRDFRGLPADGFDGRGNYNFGIEDHTIFPEIDPDAVKQVHGLNIAVVTTAENDSDSALLLRRLGMPLASKDQQER